MKKLAIFASTLAITLSSAGHLFAATNPWYGTWKINRDKSTLTGTSYTMTKTPKGYTFDYGSMKFEIGDDGKDYPTVAPETYSIKQTGNNEWLGITKTNGKETARDTMKVSSDGKTLVDKTTGTHADGTTYSSEEDDTRVGSGTGLAGTWKSAKVTSNSRGVQVLSDAGGGKMKWFFPTSQGGYVSALDGKPVTSFGPRSSPDQTIAVKQISTLEQKYTVYLKGKPFLEGTTKVSADGKVMNDTSWLVEKPAEKTTGIYEKQ
jgi:hypothetical protein